MRILNHFCDDFYVVTSEKTEATTPSAPHTTHQHSPRCYLNLPAGLPSVRVERHAQRTQRPSPAFQTTSSSLTYSDLSNLSIPQISQGSVRPVSRAMPDAVAATGLEFKELNEYEYVHLGCISAMERLLRQDHLRSEDHLCGAAARSGQLEMLQWLRANDCPWDIETCTSAAVHGHFEVLQWLRANGCPWDASTYGMATRQGHLDILQWARATAARGAGKRSCTRKVYIPSCITGQ